MDGWGVIMIIYEAVISWCPGNNDQHTTCDVNLWLVMMISMVPSID
jgi:hypothetical protein